MKLGLAVIAVSITSLVAPRRWVRPYGSTASDFSAEILGFFFLAASVGNGTRMLKI